MTELRRRMIQDLQLHGYAERTQNCYVGAVKQLAEYFHRPPDQLGEEELRQYFLHLINVKQAARSTVTQSLSGIKFFYETTLNRPFPVLGLVRPSKRVKLPVVLAREEVRLLLGLIRHPVAKMVLTLIYTCGLRLSEGCLVRIEDIDSARMLLWARNSKGGKDRSVPLRRNEPSGVYGPIGQPRDRQDPGCLRPRRPVFRSISLYRKRRFERPCDRVQSIRRPWFIRYATATQRTCWSKVSICASSRPFWVMRHRALRPSTPT